MTEDQSESKSFWDRICERLEEMDIDIEGLCNGAFDPTHFKVVCVAPDLKESVREMGKAIRDKVVMVRIDEETRKALDAWVQTGAVKSRSEAAALFIREGLKVRAEELDRLKDALNDLEEAKSRLRDKAKEVFSTEG